MASMSPDSSEGGGMIGTGPTGASVLTSTYFDGVSNRRRPVTLALDGDLEISEGGSVVASWPYADLRTVDGREDMLRLRCVSALPLARLDVHDPAAETGIRARARFLDVEHDTAAQTRRIVAWSIAAVVSIAAIVLF